VPLVCIQYDSPRPGRFSLGATVKASFSSPAIGFPRRAP